MKPPNLITHNTFSSLKRKEDVTISELRTLPWFVTHSDEELATIIEAAKIFSRAIVALHNKEIDNSKTNKKSRTIDLIANPQKKAA